MKQSEAQALAIKKWGLLGFAKHSRKTGKKVVGVTILFPSLKTRADDIKGTGDTFEDAFSSAGIVNANTN